MPGYKVKCETAGENVLAQKMAFKRGYLWLGRDGEIKRGDKGQFLFLREDGRLQHTRLDEDGHYHFRRDGAEEISLSELAALPAKERER